MKADVKLQCAETIVGPYYSMVIGNLVISLSEGQFNHLNKILSKPRDSKGRFIKRS